MLQRVNELYAGDEIRIADAKFPLPFRQELEFNAPVHETWNIVHIGMLIPETIQVYVCGKNCMRGVVLTAAEMNALDRFSSVVLTDEDLVTGTIEDVTIRGVADIIRKSKKRPKGVLVFTVCAHHFLGCDINRIYRELETEFPDIDFFRCWMDPIMQKQGITPDQKLRIETYRHLPDVETEEKTVSMLGNEFALDEDADIPVLLRKNGFTLKELPKCKTYEEFRQLAAGKIFLANYPAGELGVRKAANRLGKPFLYCPSTFDYREIDTQLAALCDMLHFDLPDVETEKEQCEKMAAETLNIIGQTPITIDYIAHPRPLGLAKYLLEHGFNVQKVYLDGISAEEENVFCWLKEQAPELMLSATMHPYKRVRERGKKEKVLAVGPKAAWFEDTGYFVNLVEGAGLHGYHGIRHMLELMQDAYRTEKDTENLVPRKGLGCESCV